ncbi:MAG: glycoside hydrolase family 57 [Candidatus Competibacter denitrificans]
MTDKRYHALVLNLHQPHGNLEHLLALREGEAREILLAMDRIPRTLADYQDIGRVHLGVSGTLMETLTHSEFQSRAYGIADCGALLWQLQNNRAIDMLGTAYYHPVMPLTPPADWEAHLARWRGVGRRWFVHSDFQGFWPPEMGFCMEMIPFLRRLGYRFVLVDSEHVRPVGKMSAAELRYRPHIARFGGEEIIVIVRDRELSEAQKTGMEVAWFEQEIRERTKACDFPPLVTTCTDGENTGWFRNVMPGSNFWDTFYRGLMERARADQDSIQPIFIKDYLDRFGASGEVIAGPGAWNTAWHEGGDFVRWAGTPAQKDALTRVDEISQAIHAAMQNAKHLGSRNPELSKLLEEAYWRVLRAQTSCNFFWGDAWVMRCHADLDQACEYLNRADPRYV